MKLIDKDALVSEIEKRRSKNAKNKLNLAAAFEDNYLLSFLDTLEVKEVDFEKEYKNFINSDNGRSMFETAKHFFELGLNKENWVKERVEECPYRQVGCTMYEGHILECKGACSWVVDYPKLKELKAQKGEDI